MNKIFPALNRGYVQQGDKEDGLLHRKPCTISDCIHIAKEAAEMSRYKDKRAAAVWQHVINSSKALKLDFKIVAETKLADGKTLLESCIEAKDWDSCFEFFYGLPDGTYSDGRVRLKNFTLIMDVQGSERQQGVLANPNGTYYPGDLSFGKKHGDGIIKSDSGNVYEGKFKDNQKHGWGVYKAGKDSRHWHEGLFEEGTWLGNPHAKKSSTQNKIMGYFFK